MPASATPWLDQARKYLGQHEIAGVRDNQFILDCFKFTNYKASHDEVPWCAAFVSRCLEETGFASAHTAWAFSYETYGKPCEIQPGAIVVFRWTSGGGHVSFVDHVIDANTVACTGGNQSDMVKLSVFPRSRIVATRAPVRASAK